MTHRFLSSFRLNRGSISVTETSDTLYYTAEKSSSFSGTDKTKLLKNR